MEEFSEIEVEIDQDTKEILARSFVEKHFCPASISKFNTSLAEFGLEQALLDSVINEIIIQEILEPQVRELENANG